MSQRTDLIPCPGCGHTTHYQWVTHGTHGAFCPECKGKRKGLPAAAHELAGLIFIIAPPTPRWFEQSRLLEVPS